MFRDRLYDLESGLGGDEGTGFPRPPPSHLSRLSSSLRHNPARTLLSVVAGSLCLLWLLSSPNVTKNTSPYYYKPQSTGFPVEAAEEPFGAHRTDIEKGEYVLGLIADLDQQSKIGDSGKWQSFLQLVRLKRGESWSLDFLEDRPVVGKMNEGGRGMELSELIQYQGRLLAGDDRTGIVYEITSDYTAVPRFILMEGDANQSKGFKIEWMSTKKGVDGQELLYVGSFGKEYTNPDGSVKNRNNMWVKVIDTNGQTQHIDWEDAYTKLRTATNTLHPNYMIFESGVWSEVHQRWFFLPRRVSHEAYDEDKDELKGSNMILSCNEWFDDIRTTDLQDADTNDGRQGFSTFKFVPDSEDTLVVAIKSEENAESDTQTSHVLVFPLGEGHVPPSSVMSAVNKENLNGRPNLLLKKEVPKGRKYEGIEFV